MTEREIFFEALEMGTPESRAAYLHAACGGDAALRRKVEELLKEHFSNDSLLAGPALEGERASEAGPPASEAPAQMIGRYKLLERIGEGGFGEVWMAEQREPVKRRVALKIIKLGMDSRQIVARFEAERQALAMMDHPNIAKIFDAGTIGEAEPRSADFPVGEKDATATARIAGWKTGATGRPYFVMELVRGIKITEYCDQKQLPTRERLNLFILVCQAIQHAHQKGIIHRDIKPSNILVTLHDGMPVPKVIDFGIAKATQQELTDKTLFTQFQQFIGTPAYISPEQAEMSGLDIDTRADIYSLGVLLYELLVGQTPFDAKEMMRGGLDALRRTIREKEPLRPSTRLTQELVAADVSRRKSTPGFAVPTQEEVSADSRRRLRLKEQITVVRGDLDWIVMKCLEKDRARRYETANGLAADIQRHLNNEPVVARPPSAAYKLQKAWQRNRLAFSAAATVLCVLILGVVVSTSQAVRATRAEHEQSRLREDAERLRANEARLRQEAEARATIIQANFLLSQSKFEDADKLIAEISLPTTQPTVEGAAAFRALGEWHAVAGRWREAAARFAAVLQLNHLDGEDPSTMDLLKCGSLLMELGDVAGYERLRREAIARFGDSHIKYVGERITKVSLLLPADDEVIRSLTPLAALQTNVEFDPLNRYRSEMAAWASLSLALMEYRRGNHALAAKWSERCLAFPPDSKVRIATARIVLAMSRHQLKQADAAQSELTQGREIIESKFRSGLGPTEDIFGRWFDWLIARILLREATSLIDG